MRLDKKDPSYTPVRLLNHLHERLNVKTDKQAAEILGYNRMYISRVRRRIHPLTTQLITRIAEVTGMNPAEIRHLAGDTRGNPVG